MSGSMLEKLTRRLPDRVRNNLNLGLFGLFKVPMIFWVAPRVVDLSDERCVIRIRLRRRTRNHVGSMYFGVLAVGADVAGGLIAMTQIQRTGRPIQLLFKDLHADFLKRAEGDTLFTSEDGAVVSEMIRETIETGERVHRTVRIVATTPAESGDEPVAEFRLTLSLKHKPRG